ncbi:hypothetical protein QR680_003017 [Steinernema hermaphroditum]|uniref:Transmembrane protein 65 n=1 Tax=Steinernema hermaphroditum TaxID=289476 RepID=A0AA39H540_9BILA|nr:hypothetical protein QR680_003017 [Steinernema hermaphroditum]
MGSKSCLRLILPYIRPPSRRTTTATTTAFYSTSGAINNLDTLRIEDEMDARTIACHLEPRERKLLAIALKELHEAKRQGAKKGQLTRKQIKKLFIVNATPFVGFGILDNMIMIFAGEYIDQSLGVYLSISTMAAAALGNIISDVAGVGLAHYVESLVSQAGIKHPVLTSEQLESSQSRYTVNIARAIGLTIGCFIGMFPLLFFDDPKRSNSTTDDDDD